MSASLNEIVNWLLLLVFFGSEYGMLDKSHPFSVCDYFSCCDKACCHTWL